MLIGSSFGFSGPLRQYFSLYRAVSQREGERGETGQMRVKMSKQPPPAPTTSAVGPCPTVNQIVGRPGAGSLPSTIAPPDRPLNMLIISVQSFKLNAWKLREELIIQTILKPNLKIVSKSKMPQFCQKWFSCLLKVTCTCTSSVCKLIAWNYWEELITQTCYPMLKANLKIVWVESP